MVCWHDVEPASCAQRFRKLGRAVSAWGCFWGPLTWGGAPGWYGPGLWPASLRATDATLGSRLAVDLRLGYKDPECLSSARFGRATKKPPFPARKQPDSGRVH